MIRRIALLSLLSLSFAACSRGGGTPVETSGSAQVTLEDVRDGCVASSLDLMQDVVDRLGPALNANSLDDLLAIAAESGCSVLLGHTEHQLFCAALPVRGETVSLTATLTYVANGVPTPDPNLADSVHVHVDAVGDFLNAGGDFRLSYDPDRGLVIEGDLIGNLDGCDLEGRLDNVVARTFADAGPGFRSVFTSGNVDLDVAVPGGAFAAGTAALFGRNAFVALDMAGRRASAEINLE